MSHLCIALDLGSKKRTHALRENFEPTILEIRCDRRLFANLGFIVLRKCLNTLNCRKNQKSSLQMDLSLSSCQSGLS